MADLQWAILSKVVFSSAVMDETEFSSRKALNDISGKLDSEQLLGAIFRDEEEWRKCRNGGLP